MSIGIFRSIRGSYIASARQEADGIIEALNAQLRQRGWAEYRDPNPDERGLRQLPCGNAGAATFAALAKRAADCGSTFTLTSLRGARWIALPMEFEGKMTAPMGRLFLVRGKQSQEFCSIRTVLGELEALAPALGVPLLDGTVAADIADRLADCQPMPGDSMEGDDDGSRENERALWLDLHLACRYSLEDGTPVVLAG